jgi:23S rRNA pseudouridine1911/1915/1917 synthase
MSKDAAAESTVHTVVADAADEGARLDRVLVRHLAGLSRSRVQALIKTGAVSLAGEPIGDPSRTVRSGERFCLEVGAAEDPEPKGEAIALGIVYEDAALIVIDKPAGLVVHPGAGHGTGTLVNALIAHCGASLSGIGGVRRPGIVHRLDKDTSGLLVVAKTDEAHRGLAEQFQAHGRDGRLSRAYLALVWGVPEAVQGVIDAPLGRDAHNRLRMAVSRRADARDAVTRWRRLKTYADTSGRPVASLLRLDLETGRTHQIRVHLAHLGHPVMGDETYARGFKSSAGRLTSEARDALESLGRQALHAAILGFEHPVTGRALAFESDLPDDMARLRAALEKGGPARMD